MTSQSFSIQFAIRFILAILLTLIVFGSTSAANAQSWDDYVYSSYNGFEAWRFDYIGPSTACAPGQLEMEFRLRDAVTLGPLSDLTDLRANIRRSNFSDGSLDYLGWQNVTAGNRLFVCSSVDDWTAVEIWANPNSVYQGTNITTIRASTTPSRVNEIGGHYVREVYLKRRDNPNPTVTPVFPVEEAVREIPQHRARLHEITSLFGATEVSGMTGQIDNWNTGDFYHEFRYVTGGLGEYEGPVIPLDDGYHEWIVKFDFNGLTPSLNGFNYSGVPGTTFIRTWIPYILDRVGPLSDLTATVVGNDISTFDLQLENTVEDYNSGLRDTRIVIRNLDTATETVITHTFPLLAGEFFGPWADSELVSAVATLNRNTNYEIVAVTTDVAGNETSTSVLTFAADPVEPPATTANLKVWNFNVPLVCTSAAATANGGVCPAIDAEMQMYSHDVAIPAGTAIPYTFQYQEVGTGVWQTGPTGSWTAGIPAFGATPTITAQFNGIPYGDYIARVIVNEPVNSVLGEIDFSNNTSGEAALTDGAGVILANEPDLKILSFAVPTPCSYDLTDPTDVCGPTSVEFQMFNRNAAIPNGVAIPYLVEYREVGGGNPWINGPTGSWTTGIAANSATPVITEMVSGIPYGEYEVRVRINYPANPVVGEIDFTDNTSSPLRLTQGFTPAPPTPANLNVQSFTVPTPCTYEAALANGSVCPAVDVTFQIGNVEADAIPASEDIEYVLQTRVGAGGWVDNQTGSWSAGITGSGVTPVITMSVSGLSYGEHFARLIVNEPANATLGEIDRSDNTSAEVPLVAAPQAASLDLTVSDDLVRRNETVDLSWRIEAAYPLTCELAGPGVSQPVSHTPQVTQGSDTSTSLAAAQNFVFRCGGATLGGFTVPPVTVTRSVEVIPSVMEI